MRDVVVVGGGPAGCKTAALLANDHDVLVLEEHESSGSPVQCTGLISERTYRMSGVKPLILNTLYGANVHFPNGGVISAVSSEPKALLIDRGDLDRKLAEAAMDAGVEIHYKKKCLGHAVKDDIVSINVGGDTIESRSVVGADGHTSLVSSVIGNNNPKEYVRGIQYDVRHKKTDQTMIDIGVGSDIAPGFFSWEIPFGEFTRVGLCSSWSAGPPIEYMKVLLKRSGLSDCEVVAKNCGKIPIGGRRTTYADNTLLIGDAAGQVKPVSGGGLYPAFIAAPYLCDTLNLAFENNDFSSRALSTYEKGWKKAVGKELKKGYSLRKVYTKLNDVDFNKAYSAVDKDSIREMLGHIDIDAPSEITKIALKNIGAGMKLALIAIRGMLR